MNQEIRVVRIPNPKIAIEIIHGIQAKKDLGSKNTYSGKERVYAF